MIREAQTHSIPLQTADTHSQISVATKNLIQSKNTLKRQWQRTYTEPEKSMLKTQLNRLQQQITENIKADLNTNWDKQLRNISKGNKKLWNLSKRFRGKNDSHLDKIKIDGVQSFNDTDKANCLANIFEKSHTLTTNYSHPNNSTIRNTINAFKTFSSIPCTTPNITVNEVENIVKALKPFKSAGPDMIQNILLKNLPIAAIEWLTEVINKCIQSSHWPASFKAAKVIPILGGKTTDRSK